MTAAPAAGAAVERVVAAEAAYIAPRLNADGELELGVLRTDYDGSNATWSSVSDTVVHTRAGSAITVPSWAQDHGLTGFGPAGTRTWWTGDNGNATDAQTRATVQLGWTRELLAGRLATDGSAGRVRRVDGPADSRVATFGIGRDAPDEDPWNVAILYDSAGEMAAGDWEVWSQGSGHLNRERESLSWGFNRAGYYCLDFEVRATLASGRPVYDRRALAIAVGDIDPLAAPVCAEEDQTTSLTLSADPAGSTLAGQPLTLTATVGPTSATGRVRFFVNDDGGERTLGGPVVVAGGQAELVTTGLEPGRHLLRAVFEPADAEAHSPASATRAHQVQPRERFVIDTGPEDLLHADIAMEGNAKGLRLFVGVDGRVERQIPLADAVLVVPDRARDVIPANPAYEFIGEPGSPVWSVPLTQKPGIPWLGISSASIDEDAFQRLSVWRLDAISDHDGGPAPGAFVLWDRFDGARPLFNTRQGLPGATRMLSRVGNHAHATWSFTAPGVYCLAMSAGNRFAATGAPAADAAVLTVVVGDAADPYAIPTCAERGTRPVASHQPRPERQPGGTAYAVRADGERRAFYDLRPEVVDGGLRVDVLEGDPAGPGMLRDIDEIVFGVTGSRELGESPDANRYVLGSDTTAIDSASVAGDLRWRLVGVDGPGTLTLSDEWHDLRARTLLSSAVGTAPDHHDLWPGRRDPLAWRFGAHGVYCVTFEWTGVAPDGRPLVTRRTLTFAVGVDPTAVTPCPQRPPSPPAPPGPGDATVPALPATPATPAPMPSPRLRMSMRVVTPKVVRHAAMRRRDALRVRCGLSTAGTCHVRATVSRATARRLGLRSRVIAAGRRTLRRPGTATVVVQLDRRARRAIARSRGSLHIRLDATARARGQRTVTRTAQVTVSG
ncbi:choice-of-anchor M domain-containing protein [Solirubrobacter deserti]|uniref:Choice-of-anchor M domain-containing protein n=1 Tax=Solirubrobacter deserti TaxID=2282478 RepID=A0ABT4RPU4_9ACTN|nr:choice-of-anchor M domain-containing protein [Solirubrobacter deserti]MDA0140564.1 choice-of-anchor M domain-containing protein [Solirubrobacter deserti]